MTVFGTPPSHTYLATMRVAGPAAGAAIGSVVDGDAGTEDKPKVAPSVAAPRCVTVHTQPLERSKHTARFSASPPAAVAMHCTRLLSCKSNTAQVPPCTTATDWPSV